MNRFLFSVVVVASMSLTSMNCKHNVAGPPPPPTKPDTTTHNVSWFVDTLGTQGFISDCWIFSPDSVIVVGEIHTGQTDRYDSSGHWVDAYNAAVWNGTSWTLKRIYFSDGGTIILIHTIYGIYVSGSKDIWLAAGSVFHWDGSTIQAEMVFSRLQLSSQNGTIERLWGSSNFNIHGVGASGTCVHFDGNSWRQISNNTGVDLQDTWGLDANHAWATGTNTGDGHCVVLQYNGSSWSTIYDNMTVQESQVQGFYTVWSHKSDELLLSGQSWIRSMNPAIGTFTLLDSLSRYEARRIRGTGGNDIFQVGYGAEVLHYNGASWHHYSELSSLNSGSQFIFLRCVDVRREIIVTGGDAFTGLNGYPLVLRGYR